MRDPALRVRNERETNRFLTDFLQIFHPLVVGLDRVGGDGQDLHVALFELRLQFGENGELRRGHGGAVWRLG